MPDDKRVDRRRFFRAALGEMFKPLERKAAPLQRAIEEFGRLKEAAGASHLSPAASPAPSADRPAPLVRPPEGRTSARGPSSAAAPASPTAWLRPPGALPEDQFANVCSRCGDCARVCPAQCIRLEPDGRGDGLPFIDVDTMPCVLCDGLLCMHHCPTNALIPVPLAEIDMGTAVWHESTCVRSRREECTTCIDQCPVGPAAIELRDNRVHVHEDGCVGCGICEHYCPTVPKSITVTPRAARGDLR